MKVSVAIPVYQNAGSLKSLHSRLTQAIKNANCEYQIVFTDDGSTDNSLSILKEIADSDQNVSVIKLSKNFGQHAANNAAFQLVDGDIIVNMSADLQDPPEIITEMIALLSKDLDIVLAVRNKTSETFIKKITSWAHYKLVRISVPTYPKKGFDFWAVNKKAFKAFMSFNDIVRRNQTDLLSIGFNVGYVDYSKNERVHGKSQYNFLKRLNISLSQILATAFWPLRLASTLGFLFTFIGIIYSVYLFINYFINDTPFNGWTPIMMLLLIIGGIIMLILGIIGEYLWRIYFETKHRPLYFVDYIYKKEKHNETS